jgi:hypothetical protein
MKTKYPNLFGILAALLLVVSFVLPTSLVSPATVAADPGICKWDNLREPNALTGLQAISFDSEIVDLAVGSDFNTMYAIVTLYNTNLQGAGLGINVLFVSSVKGLLWSISKYYALQRETGWGTRELYQVAVAPDNPNFIAVTSDNTSVATGPKEVWVSQNGGSDWDFTNFAINMGATETIRAIDISVDYGGKRDIAVATATGTGGGRIFAVKSTGFSGWQVQTTTALGAVDFFDIMFSPSYASDAALAVVFADNTTVSTTCPITDATAVGATWYNVALRDIDANGILSWAFTGKGVEVRDATWAEAASPGLLQLNKATLQLPSDFSGQAASLRRAYIALDALNGCTTAKYDCARDGIFRIDDGTQYTLMDTHSIMDKSIYSIAYFGTYASGKLLAGERLGYPCTATVPTWFTDSPTTCPIPCWYPALKPTTGAACNAYGGCAVSNKCGVGAAIVAWAPPGTLAYAATGANAYGKGASWWYYAIRAPKENDESALAISRNNGETWNQVAFIDTIMTKFTDIAPTPDCKTVYLASVNSCAGGCCGFDSVWRSTLNPDVAAPIAAQPVGTLWERVFCHVTAPDCTETQTDYAILRLVPYCADPTGEIIAWAAYNGPHDAVTAAHFTNGHGVAFWSPDFGDYWAQLTPRSEIQDFCFESRTVMYFLSPGGLVQKMPYTGTAWSSSLANVDTSCASAHTIAAYPEGKVIVGAGTVYNSAYYAASYSSNMNTDNPSFTVSYLAGNTGGGNVHVAFDTNFADNNMYYLAVDNIAANGTCSAAILGSVYRNNPAAQLKWADTNMMSTINGVLGCPQNDGQYGIVLAFTGGALYSANMNCAEGDCGVNRTLTPLEGMPKPGIAWDFLNVGLSGCFTLEPSSLKLCGCCTEDTDSTLYGIDDANYSVCPGETHVVTLTGHGLIWAFTDCLAKRGPALITEDATLIGCDPVSGRAQEVNLCWEQLCVADAYDIEISKNTEFTIKIVDWASESCTAFFLSPADITAPCVYFPAGGSSFTLASSIAMFGNLECGHTYYWRVKARECATGQVIRSPWSEVRSFTVKAGLPVVSPYLGLQLLSPNNGCLGCPVQPVSFSWSPFKETTKYKFVLASDAAMTQVVKEAEVTTTAYEYDGQLNYSTNYFWRVMSEEPAPSDWSATFSFQTEAQPVVTTAAEKPAPTPIWVWVVIAIGAILVIVTLVLIFKTRRV